MVSNYFNPKQFSPCLFIFFIHIFTFHLISSPWVSGIENSHTVVGSAVGPVVLMRLNVGLDVMGLDVGIEVLGLDVVGLDEVGLDVVGLDVVGLVVGIEVLGLDVVGLDVVGLDVVGLVVGELVFTGVVSCRIMSTLSARTWEMASSANAVEFPSCFTMLRMLGKSSLPIGPPPAISDTCIQLQVRNQEGTVNVKNCHIQLTFIYLTGIVAFGSEGKFRLDAQLTHFF